MNFKIIFAALMLVLQLFWSSEVMAACTCTDLQVKYNTNVNSTALSTQYCVKNTQNFPECTLDPSNPCGAGKKTYKCPIGGASGTVGNDDWFGVGLEYVMTGTNLDTCKHGLALQRDITEDGTLQPNKKTNYTMPQGVVNFDTLQSRIYSGGSNNIPHVGDTNSTNQSKFTSDNYAAINDEQTIKIEANNTKITFSDLPSVYLDPGDDAKKIVQDDVFMASVRDSSSNNALCGCEFQLTATKNAGSTTLTSVTLVQKAKKNCTFMVVQ